MAEPPLLPEADGTTVVEQVPMGIDEHVPSPRVIGWLHLNGLGHPRGNQRELQLGHGHGHKVERLETPLPCGRDSLRRTYDSYLRERHRELFEYHSCF